LDALCPEHPHPVLYLVGEEGSAKTTAVNIARALTDPSSLPLRNLPTSKDNLFVGSDNARVLAFDNVSTISPDISDALCQIVSGSGYAKRKLYTDSAQILIGGQRAVILNGLANAIAQSDLTDRSIIVPMMRIRDNERQLDSVIWPHFESAKGKIFGALLKAVSRGLRNVQSVRLDKLPRMADFARWIVATEVFERDAFLKVFEGAQAEAINDIADDNPVVVAINAFMDGRNEWYGTAVQLMAALKLGDQAEAKPTTWRTWPANPSAFGKALTRATATLRKLGIKVERGKAKDRKSSRMILLRHMSVPSVAPELADVPGEAESTEITTLSTAA
jgi:hypothetical protein